MAVINASGNPLQLSRVFHGCAIIMEGKSQMIKLRDRWAPAECFKDASILPPSTRLYAFLRRISVHESYLAPETRFRAQ